MEALFPALVERLDGVWLARLWLDTETLELSELCWLCVEAIGVMMSLTAGAGL